MSAAKKDVGSSNKRNIRPPTNIPLKKFMQYCEQFLESAKNVKAEFQKLSTISAQNQSLISIAHLPENYMKNRYANILPYDKTRVTIETDSSSDYINASFIRGYNEVEQKYIACQGPKLNTCRDFWQMVFQYNVDTVVMLCRLREKNRVVCDKYFPDLKEITVYNDIAVECIALETHSTFVIRNFAIVKDSIRKIVNHVHFQEWPDFDVPANPASLVSLCKYVRQISNQNPIIVHCSAGIGRTGTFITCDILLDYIQKNKPINIFNIILKLREQRTSMVQSEVQYRYLHKCVSYILQTTTSSSNEILMHNMDPQSSQNFHDDTAEHI